MIKKTLFYYAKHQYENHKKNTLQLYNLERNKIYTVAFCLFAAQILELISLFIPLKVIIILGSNAVPAFISHYFKIYSVDTLIVFLVCITAITYFLSLAFSLTGLKLRASTLKKVTPTIKSAQHKISDAVIQRTFIQYTEFIANSLLVIFTALLVSLLTPFMFVGIIIMVIFEFLILQAVSSIQQTYCKYLFSVLKNYAREFSQYLVAINFSLVMIIIIFQYLSHIPIKTLPTILAFMMARKMFSSARNVILYLHKMA